MDASSPFDTVFTPAYTPLPPGALRRAAMATSGGASAQVSPREREVVSRIASGQSNKEIAFDLGISVSSVATHRRNALRKLGLHSNAELTALARASGRGRTVAGAERLTAAEREVSRAAIAGYNNAQIALRRGTSCHTVANQLASVFRKLGIASRRELYACGVLGAPATQQADPSPGDEAESVT